MAAGLVISFYLLAKKVYFGTHIFDQHGPLMLLGAVLILAGVQLISSGLIGEMLSRTYFESQGKPTYAIERMVTARNQSTRPKPDVPASIDC
jgi:hypothetical protein